MRDKKEDLIKLEKIINEVLEPDGFIFKRNLWYKYQSEVYTIVRIRRHTVIRNFFIDFWFFLDFLNEKKSYDFKTIHSDCDFGSIDREYRPGFKINTPEEAAKLQVSLRNNLLPELKRRGIKDYYIHSYSKEEWNVCSPPSSAVNEMILAYAEKVDKK